ncbi:helix-turn-helix domain-containing protein [Methylomonas sp. 2B]|uniref:Transposase n=1 Tax=Methylomonas koyamae TaxID=702114 RepID=A0A177P0E6_9GAMM|nr:hypothetical protein A1355_22060 [Methylomonas koyamae]
MTSLQQRQNLIGAITEATTAGARQDQACAVLGLSPRTLQRWQARETLAEETGDRNVNTRPGMMTWTPPLP